MVTSASFRKALESLPSVEFAHRKVSAPNRKGVRKITDSVSIPISVLEAVKSASRVEAGPEGSAKQMFERLVLESVIPGASQGLKNSEITSLVSPVCDAWFPKDEGLGEFKTHPISREVPEGQNPSAYFWKEEAVPSKESGVRCAPRPFRGESVDVETLAPEELAKKANSEEMGRLLRGEISPTELVEAVKTRLSKPKAAQKVDEAAIADLVARRVMETLQKMGITPPSAE